MQAELVRLKAESQSTTILWIDIILLTFLRFSIQLSNITCVWIASWLYRRTDQPPHLAFQGLKQDLKSLSAEFKGSSRPSYPKNFAIEDKNTALASHRVAATEQKSAPSKLEQPLIAKQELTTEKQPARLATTAPPPQPEVRFSEEEKLKIKAEEIQDKLNGYLEEINSSSDYEKLCQEIRLKPKEIDHWLEKRDTWNRQDMLNLAHITKKVREIYLRQS